MLCLFVVVVVVVVVVVFVVSFFFFFFTALLLLLLLLLMFRAPRIKYVEKEVEGQPKYVHRDETDAGNMDALFRNMGESLPHDVTWVSTLPHNVTRESTLPLM